MRASRLRSVGKDSRGPVVENSLRSATKLGAAGTLEAEITGEAPEKKDRVVCVLMRSEGYC